VAEAFAVAPAARAALERGAARLAADITPLSKKAGGPVRAILILFAILFLVSLLSECDEDDCAELRATFGESSNEYRQCVARRGSGGGLRTGGGSFGGWSSGGGHK
jgi:hypothetical protein